MMTKNEYIMRLKAALAALPKKERDKYGDYYSELVDDRVKSGVSEEQAVSELENVYEAAERIKAEAGIQPERKKSLGVGAIIGIIAGALVLICIIAALLHSVFAARYNRQGSQPAGPPAVQSQIPAKSAEYFEYTYPAGVNLFTLNLNKNYIEIRPSKDESFRLCYYVTDDAPLKLTEDTDMVKLEDPDRTGREGSLTFGGSWQTAENTVTLYIPAGSDVNIEAATVSGGISASGVTVKNADFANVSGDIEITSLVCRSLSVVTASGGIDLDYTNADSVELTGTYGGIDLDGVTTGRLDIATVSGDVELEGTSFTSLSCASVSGNLEGSLLGGRQDYSVSFDTVSGHNALGNLTGGPISIEFSSVSGSLELDFDLD